MVKKGILAGYRALDLTDGKGHVTGKILASMGVETIKVEPPGGDPGRSFEPGTDRRSKRTEDFGWLVNNTGKQGVTVDIQTERGKHLFLRLVETADIVLESFQPGHLDSLGLGYRELRRTNPELIMTSITLFGQTGPYSSFKGAELIASAMGGALITNGYIDRPPVKEALEANIFHANAVAALATTMAIYARRNGQQGQHVDIAIQEVATTRNMTGKIVHQFDDRLIPRSGDRHQMGLHSARWIWQCKDGFLWFNLMGGKVGAPANRALTQWIEDDGLDNPLKEMGDWTKFDRSTIDPETRKRLETAMDRFFRNHTKEEIAGEGQKRGVRACVANSPEELLDHPQLCDRDFWAEFRHPANGPAIKYPKSFFHASETENTILRGAPRVGEHNVEIYHKQLGICEEELNQLRSEGVI